MQYMANNELEHRKVDTTAAIARAVVGVCPVIGPMITEVVDALIPGQRLERIADFLAALEKKVCVLDADLRVFTKNAQGEGLGLMEDGMILAARATSGERRQRLADLLAHALTQEELREAEARKMLNLFTDLTDAELIVLAYHAQPPFSQSPYHKEMQARHPDVLRPASREAGISQAEIDRGALRDSYLSKLTQSGLLSNQAEVHLLTPLGSMLLRYIQNEG